MDAAVSLHHHGALPSAAAASLPPHHRALHLRHPPPASSISARLTVPAPPRRSSSSSASASAAPPAHPARAGTRITTTSSRAATGYAAALADASLRAGTLPGAARHARALLRRLREPPRGQRLEEPDARVGALVRLLVGKGKAAMVADVMAEFAALCDHLLAPPPPSSTSTRSKRAHGPAHYD
ncbi:uncharacterized protein LOC123407243 [Hordeum vulgare subsp. vulgare]|uniref:Predicted protein n=1 Tax=Hordeum vulgare subsp. vulgare TaxID=112509 RepID=F2D2D8_HORVV|nr:uncharacterized protein LOC123407243 [Hordeum vulgare subsp. vulgare]KAI4971296.1 hypothetical protein ZWY2020_002210 [Hordeum vulgare]KAI4971308.1 hypothetical protein ZWY2020_002222 [Hordeum vulgare]BAJ89259.1 predicted protein [Hordeum vulgare subsp. vulgare]BAJ90897.1 predicted protein [Hordeum vulgare subsp. vulgare]